MNRKIIGRIILVWLAGAVFLAGYGCSTAPVQGSLGPIGAGASKGGLSEETDAEQLNQAEKERDRLQQEKKEIDKSIDSAQRFADDVAKYVHTLDVQVMNLMLSIQKNKHEIKRVQEELDSVQQEYDKAQSNTKEQMEKMAAHIQYIYENSRGNYLGYLMEAGNLADLFAREEYVERVTSFDDTALREYQNVYAELVSVKKLAEQKEDEILAKKSSLEYEKKKMAMITKEKKRQVEVFQGTIRDSRQKSSNYARQIVEEQNKIETLLQDKRDEIGAQERNHTIQVVPVSGEYAWPLPVSGRISSPFGYRHAPTAGASTYHKGVDISVPQGTPILATKKGKVVTAVYSSTAGNFVSIYHGGGVYSYYMHASLLKVSAGDRVKQGQVIALSGSTGISTAPHLHFGLYKGGNYVNPMYYVKQP